MTGREWKPGDVALVRNMYGQASVAVRTGTPGNMGWSYSMEATAGSTQSWHADREAKDVIRPLAVIDPEDRDQAVRLIIAFEKALGSETHVKAQDDAMQSALRSLIEPPRPEEPTGLGAVVETADGHLWTRARSDAQPFVGAHGLWSNYGGLSAVRVLSEGVTP